MWASKTDYISLYTAEDFTAENTIAHFDPDVLSGHVAQMCREIELCCVADISLRGNAFSERLRTLGLQSVSCGWDAGRPDAIYLDIAGRDHSATEQVRSEIRQRFGSSSYLLTCLGVLEHMDVEDVAAAVSNLRCMTSDFALVSISTRPSGWDNAYHATLAPLSTWKEIFAAAGFDVVRGDFFHDVQRILPADLQNPELFLAAHWTRADPFRSQEKGEPHYLLLQAARDIDDAAIAETVNRLLDISYRHEKRRQFGAAATCKRVGLNIHHPQDFFNLRPILDVLKRENTVGFIRPSTVHSDELSLIRGFFRRCGVPLVEFESIKDIAWGELKLDILLSAAESSVSVTHTLSRQLVEAAKLNGVFTILLQHGIWIEPFKDRIVASASDVLLTWGREQGEFFKSTHRVMGAPTSVGLIPDDSIRPVGAPKFTDIVIQPQNDILRTRLGLDLTRYRKVALLGTNFKWGAHKGELSAIRDGLSRTIRENKDIFFLVKPHPSERVEEYEVLAQENSLIVDDIILGAMDLHISRLIHGVDIVVSSLSTLLLDAVIAGKPFVQYATGNEFSYQFCDPIELSALGDYLKDEALWNSPEISRFRSHYADAEDGRFYEKLSALFEEANPQPVSDSRLIETYSLAAVVEYQWQLLVHERQTVVQERQRAQEAETHLHREHLRFAASLADVQAELAEERRQRAEDHSTSQKQHRKLTKQYKDMEKRYKDSHARLEMLQNSASWRLTAPLRRLITLFR